MPLPYRFGRSASAPRPARHTMATAMHSADKPLNQMDRLADMGHFPPLVNLGATVNVLTTVAVTHWIRPEFPYIGPIQPWPPVTWPPVLQALAWAALVLAFNLAPVVLLRRTMTAATPYPPLRQMDFVHDQHKFSDWVYLAASANMAFWILTGWATFAVSNATKTLVIFEIIAGLATFSPVLLRGLGRKRTPTA